MIRDTAKVPEAPRRTPARASESSGERGAIDRIRPAEVAPWTFGEVSITAAPGQPVQRETPRVGSRRTPHETEADSVAAQVLRMPERRASVPSPGTHVVLPSPAVPNGLPAAVQVALQAAAAPLDAGTRSYFEPRFGCDLSSVLVHTGPEATASARAIDARAYTSGTHIVFADGEFAPQSAAGRRLLAHELVHVVQQQGGRVASPAPVALRAPGGTVQRQAAVGEREPSQPVVVRLLVDRGRTGVAWAILSDGSMKLVDVFENRLEAGRYRTTPSGPASGAAEAEYIQLTGRGLKWRQPTADFAPGQPVAVEVRASPEERLDSLPDYIREFVTRDLGRAPRYEQLVQAADQGDSLVRDNITREDLALADTAGSTVAVEGKAPPENLVDSLRRRGFTDFPTEEVHAKRLADEVRGSRHFDAAEASARWKEFPAESAAEWERYARGKYEVARGQEEEAWREAFRRIDAAAGAVNAIAWVTVAVAGSLVAGHVWTVSKSLDFVGAVEAVSGVKFSLWMKALTATFVTQSFAQSLLRRYEEAKVTGTNPLLVVVTAIDDALGASKVYESITDESLMSGAPLNRSVEDRVATGILGLLEGFTNALAVREFMPAAPPSVSPASLREPVPTQPTPAGSAPALRLEQGGGAGTGVAAGRLRPVNEDLTYGPEYRPAAAEVPEAQFPFGTRAANENVTPVDIRAAANDPTVPRFVKPGRPSAPRPIEGPRTAEEWKQAGGKIESGTYRPPREEVTAQPKERSLESQRAEQAGLAQEAPEVAAINKGPLGAQSQSRWTEVGNAVHEKLIEWIQRFRSGQNLEQAARLEEIVPGWPEGVLPNRLQFVMRDGRLGRPDGIELNGGYVIELKPNTESFWAKGGPYQAQEYADVLNAAKYGGRTDWKPLTLTYDAAAAEKYLVELGYLAPKPKPPAGDAGE